MSAMGNHPNRGSPVVDVEAYRNRLTYTGNLYIEVNRHICTDREVI
jgi:hypothetical protein